jgi:hypothetical protein
MTPSAGKISITMNAIGLITRRITPPQIAVTAWRHAEGGLLNSEKAFI